MTAAPAVVTVSFNSGEALGRCLDSIATHAPASDVVVVDNASEDGSTRNVERRPRVTLVVNRANLGFARAVNLGVETTSGEFVLLLNPDCALLPRAIEQLVEQMRMHPECAIAGPRILNDDGSTQGSARGDPSLLTGLFGRTTLLTRLFPRSRLARRNVRTDAQRIAAGESFEVDWVSGACMLARRQALEAVGGFDERYFLYWEDADLCRRLRARGCSIRYVPSAAVVHSGGLSSRRVPALATRAFHDAAYIYYATHVARTPVGRGVARVLLALRCRWKLLGLRAQARSTPAA